MAEGFDKKFHPLTTLACATTSTKSVILAGARLRTLQAECKDNPELADAVSPVYAFVLLWCSTIS
jgi:hypothetical protein